MATIQVYQPNSVRKESLSGGIQSSNASAESFGLNEARQTEQLASGVMAAGKLMYAVDKEQTKDEARKALVAAEEEKNNTVVNLYSASDKAVVFDEGKDQFEEIRKKHSEKLSPQALELFDANFRSSAATDLRSLAKLQAAGINKNREETWDAQNKEASKNAAINLGAPMHLDKAIETITLNNNAKYAGSSPEVVQAKRDENLNAMFKNIVEVRSERLGAISAKEFLDENQSKMPAATYEVLSLKLQKPVLEEKAFADVVARDKSGMSYTDQNKTINAIADKEQREMQQKALADYTRDKEHYERVDSNNTRNDVISKIDKGTKVNVDMYNLLPEDKMFITKYMEEKKDAAMGKPPKITDGNVWVKTYNDIAFRKITQPQLDSRYSKGNMSFDDYKDFTKMITNGSVGDRAEALSVMKKSMAANIPGSAKPENKKKPEVLKDESNYINEFRRAMEFNPNKLPIEIDKELNEPVTIGYGILGGAKTIPRWKLKYLEDDQAEEAKNKGFFLGVPENAVYDKNLDAYVLFNPEKNTAKVWHRNNTTGEPEIRRAPKASK